MVDSVVGVYCCRNRWFVLQRREETKTFPAIFAALINSTRDPEPKFFFLNLRILKATIISFDAYI